MVEMNIGNILPRAEETSSSECEVVGEAMADIAGIGIIVGFVGQALISLIVATWAFFFSKFTALDVTHDEGTVEYEIEQKRLEFVSDMLMVGNDIQMLLGCSYMISVFAAVQVMDLYHLHLVFDIVSFVGVSNAAALICWTYCNTKLRQPKGLGRRSQSAHFTPRHRATYLFATMFLALTILLCLRLNEWSPDHEPGRCYHADTITLAGASHPSTDKIYVITTGIYMIIAMLSAAFAGARWRRPILVSSFLQFPVHLYMALALRYANQGKFSGEETHENGWDFGQTTAVVLLAMAVKDLLAKGYEFVEFEKRLRKNGPGKKANAGNQLQGVVGGRELMDMGGGRSGVDEETAYYGAGGVGYDDRSSERAPLARLGTMATEPEKR